MRRRLDGLTLGTAAGMLATAMGVLAMSGQLIDPSFFTHVATGRIILDEGFPRVDPYTFTAAGEHWVVQSWLAGSTFALLDRTVGMEAVRALVAVLGGLVAAGVWRLTRPAASLTGRLLLVLLVLGIGFSSWSERPLIIGLVALVVTLLVADGQLPAPVLVPVGYVWVNTHGSWPLGLGLVVLLAIGRRLDGERPEVELRTLAWLAGGVASGVLNPYGWRILTFPVELLQRREALSHIVEWRPPTYDRSDQQLFLVMLVVAAIAFARRRTWRSSLPQAAFVVLALTGARNVVPASIVLACCAAPSFAGWGTLDGERRGVVARALAVTSVALVAVVAVVIAVGDPVNEVIYPVEAQQWLEEHDLSPATHRVIAREAVGNWWEFTYGPTQLVFVDDRIEVLPLQVVEDQTDLLDGVAGWEAIVDRYDPEAIVWEVEEPLADLLEASADWQVTHRDDRYLVAVPAG